MSNAYHRSPSTVSTLPSCKLLEVFQLLAGTLPPEAPAICWLAPVCRRWRDLARQLKGLKVLFQGNEEQRVASLRAWLRRHAPQVEALATTSDRPTQVLRALAAAAAIAAAAGKPLPLQRLVVTGGQLLEPEVCEDVLQPLLATLPHLQHLRLSLAAPHGVQRAAASAAAAGALAPLQHSTSLTSLVLEGPWCQGDVADAAHVQLLSGLLATLRSLTWTFQCLGDLSFHHLTGLTHLSLHSERAAPDLPVASITALQHLRKLELPVADWVSDEALLAVREQLVRLTPREDLEMGIDVLGRLTHLQSLVLTSSHKIPELLQVAPQLQQLHVTLYEEEDLTPQAWSRPWVLRHYSRASSLQRLSLWVYAPQAAPLELCALRQLRQLDLFIEGLVKMTSSDVASWACALASLVNLELLSVPVMLTSCRHPWLAGLPRLVVLEVWGDEVATDMESAAAHISRLLASETGSSSHALGQEEQVRLVCFCGWRSAQLHQAVAAAVPVLPPNKHLFRGSWNQLQECGVELWPAPVAARLQQLL